MNYRLYAFTAHHYLSPLQCGIQTAHVVSELHTLTRAVKDRTQEVYDTWASVDKTIIVCGAGNHEGVTTCCDKLALLALPLDLPFALFVEDERSMNGMATACGVIVPQEYYDTVFDKDLNAWCYVDMRGYETQHRIGSPKGDFINHIKSYRLV